MPRQPLQFLLKRKRRSSRRLKLLPRRRPRTCSQSRLLRVRSLRNRSQVTLLSFDRALSVSGEAQLIVSTGSGNIHLTRGTGNQIHIHAQIHVSHEGSEEQARQIAANPPIEQSGNVIRVGQQHEDIGVESASTTRLKRPLEPCLKLTPVQATSLTRALARTRNSKRALAISARTASTAPS